MKYFTHGILSLRGIFSMRKRNCVQEIMHEKRISYNRLSRLSGVSKGALHQIANMKELPRQNTKIAIAKGFRMKVGEVCYLDD